MFLQCSIHISEQNTLFSYACEMEHGVNLNTVVNAD